MLPADRETGGYTPLVITDRLEKWWVEDKSSSAGLDEARHRNIGWWAWHAEVTRPEGRRPCLAEGDSIVQLYQERGISVPVVEDTVRYLLELTPGPFSGIDRTLQVIEARITANVDKLLLPPDRVRCLSMATLRRLAPARERVRIESYYMVALFPAAVESFLDHLDGPPDVVRLALVRWLDENADSRLGSIGEGARVLFDAWERRRSLVV
jgi:hypothetical protein